MESEKDSNVKSNRRCLNQILDLFSYSEEAEHSIIEDVAGANDSGFGQSPSVSPSEFKFPEESLPYLSSSLDAAIEMYNKKGMRFSCAQADDSKKEADMLGSACDNTHVGCGVCDDCRQSHLSEDSQLYLSAQEQDFDDGDSPREFSEQSRSIVPGAGIAKEQNVTDMSKDCSPAAEYDASDKTSPEAAVPELPHLCQHSLPPAHCSGVTCHHQEGQAKYRGAVCATILESYSCGNKEGGYSGLLECDSLENREMEDTPLTDSVLPPQAATSEKLPENNDGLFRSCSGKPENPLPSRQERASAAAVRFCEGAEDSDFHSCEESGACAASCTDCTAEGAETPFPVSRALAYKDPFFGVKAVDNPASGDTSCLNLECGENLKTITSDSTVNQTVDVSSDFRARFTTSRSTSAEACLLSRTINTEITMMNKSRPVGWHHKTHAGFACNTDRSCGAGSTKEMQPQLTDVLEKHSDGNNLTAERSSQTEDQSESKQELCSDNVKISTDRMVHLYKEAVENSASNYYQKTLQRAIEAELQVLSTHYQMCYQYCLKIYKLASEENMCLSRGNGDMELGSSLMLVLEELKENYNSMRMKIKMGIPLSRLPPLSVELKFSVSFSCKVFREDVSHDSVSDTIKAHFKGPKQQEKKTSGNMDDPQTTCLTDADQPGDSASSKTFGNQDKECGCVTKEERNEYWFDAKEDLTADSSVISEETKNEEKQGTGDLREVKITESRRECSLICVGGQSSSASEDDLRSGFQKYEISDTPISVDSSNCRGESLPFKDADKAKLAGEETIQEKMKGKPIGVKLGNTSLENKYLVSQVHANKLWHEVQPVDNSQRNDQEKSLTSASSSVKAPDTSLASEKMHLLPITASKVSCPVQEPSEATFPALKSATEDSVPCSLRVHQKDTGEKSVQKTSAPFSTHPSDVFIPPHTLNLTSFTKLLKKLQEMHPEVSRDEIVNAVVEVRRNNNGILSGLSISSIVERTSIILRKSSPSSGLENQCK